ncbi:MAG: menaquinone biosynthesis protein [Phycisphaera sp.]|nr:MAG: menaquinone biosynthesis protein [Phycisphaera sp.]
MDPIRVACVRYLNTAPLVEGLDKLEGLTLIPAVPADIAPMVRSGKAEIGLASVIDAVGDPELAILPAGMIGSDGPTLTVRLFSSVPLANITAVCADADSHTSIALASVLLAEQFGVSPKFVPFNALERVALGGETVEQDADGWPATLLLIGDKVVTHSPPAVRYPHQLDLGEAWKTLTGLPFVYAAWTCRADAIDTDEGQRRMALASAMLDRQRRHNATRLDWLVQHWAPKARWPVDLAQRYIGELLRYDLGERERESVGKFFELCTKHGITEAAAPCFADVSNPSPIPGNA